MRHSDFKASFRYLLAGVALLMAGTSATRAAQIDGSIALQVNATTIDTASVTTATSFTFGGIKTGNPSDGDFTGSPSGLTVDAGPKTLALSPTSFVFGSLAGFGQFVAGSVLFDTTGFRSRDITLSGTFTAGALFPGLTTPVDALLVIALGQAGGPNRPISSSFTLVTMATAVPEPASLAMLGLGLAGILGAGRLRRKAP